MNIILFAILLSMAPVSELRGGIPWAILNGISPAAAYITCVAANIAVVPLIFLFLELLHHHFERIGIYKKIFDKFVERTRRKLHKKVEKYGYLGLTLFVAVPLPITGAWTGTLGAWLFGMDKLKSMLAILLGVAIAGMIVTFAVLAGGNGLSIFIKHIQP